MGRRLNHATPTVVNTELIPFDESFFIGAEGQLEQWYYDNTTQYAPNRRLSPLILTPHLSIFDKETGDSYSSDAESTSTSYVPFYTVVWYALEYVNDGYVESVITNLTDSADADYVISGNSLIVKKNVSYSHGVTIRCVATYKDPRDANNAYTTQGTVLLTTNRDAKVDLPEVSIISPSARGFNPLTDYKTVDGVEVQDSLFDFEAVVSNKPTVDPGVQYRVDGGGTEEIVEEEGVMTALPSMDIRYPDSDVMLDQSFLYRVTANGTKPNVDGGAFVTALRGNTVKWNELLPENKRNASKSYSADATYYASILTGLSITITESHKYYGRAYVTRNISDNNGINFNFNSKQSIVSASNGSSDGLKSAIVNATSSFVATYIQANNYTYKHGFSAGDSYSISNITYIDLTEMFGTDAQIAAALGITTADITTTIGVAAFESWLETNLGKRDYYPYDAGSLVPTRFSAVKTVSFNLWNENWELGTLNLSTGENTAGRTGIRSKGYIKVWPNTRYYLNTASPKICCYDKNEVFLSSVNASDITTPANAEYCRFSTDGIYGTSYQNNLNFGVYGSRNGQYVQHWEASTPLAITSITGKLNGEGESVIVFPDGMKAAETIYDEIKVENGVLKAIKRVATADLGAKTWSFYNETNKIFRASLTPTIPADYAKLFTNTEYVRSTVTAANSMGDKSMEVFTSNYFYIRDTAFETVEEFKASMEGKTLYYELDTPQEYILDPVQDPCIFEWFGMNGSQEVRVETLPWYVSGQGTSHLTVDAMFGEHINVVATAKSISGQPTPSKAYAAVEWRVPDMDINVMSKNGGAVRSDSTSFDFEPICNMNGTVISDTVKSAHLRFNWKYRKSNSTVENDLGWGATKTIAASNLLNTKTVSGTLPSTHVYSYAYLLGAWEVQTSTDPVPYSQPTTTKDGVTYVRKVPTI